MINVLLAADFPIERTGIASTASSILCEDYFRNAQIFCDQPLRINGIKTTSASHIDKHQIDFVFTHLEYSKLPDLTGRWPNALFHVGDWPLNYWASIIKRSFIKGLICKLRCIFRLSAIDKATKLVYVARADCDRSLKYGFFRSMHIPIGVHPSVKPLASCIDTKSICFSGNFRYPPNQDAAKRLIKLARTQLCSLKIILIGYFADDFHVESEDSIEIHANVPSVVEFLTARRPIYVSLVTSGAGAKNKILEAMVSGCPIICTPESIDDSIKVGDSIKIITSDSDFVNCVKQFTDIEHNTTLLSSSTYLAKQTLKHRGWNAVAESCFKALEH
jgi:glycosyltransferase involved in cell wall biosynthesis